MHTHNHIQNKFSFHSVDDISWSLELKLVTPYQFTETVGHLYRLLPYKLFPSFSPLPY